MTRVHKILWHSLSSALCCAHVECPPCVWPDFGVVAALSRRDFVREQRGSDGLLIRGSSQGIAYAVIWVMIAASVAPMQIVHMAVRVDIIGRALMAVVANPPLIAKGAPAPLNQGGFADPGVVIVLADV